MDATPQKNSSARSLIFGGLLPVIIFTVIEEKFGTKWGLLAGLIFGVGEVCYEKLKYKQVETITWIGNGLIFITGGISLLTNEGVWFKLQPAIMEFFMFLFLVGSFVMKKPFLNVMMQKQKMAVPQNVSGIFDAFLKGLTLRLGFFFFAQSILATYAAFYWSTRVWAILKGVGFTVSLLIYMLVEAILMRRQIKRALVVPLKSPEVLQDPDGNKQNR